MSNVTGSLCGLLRQTFELWGRPGRVRGSWGSISISTTKRGDWGLWTPGGHRTLCCGGGRNTQVHSPSFVADTLFHRELDTWSGCAHPAAGRSTAAWGGECSGEVSDSGDRDPPSPQPSPAQPGRGETSTAAGR